MGGVGYLGVWGLVGRDSVVWCPIEDAYVLVERPLRGAQIARTLYEGYSTLRVASRVSMH